MDKDTDGDFGIHEPAPEGDQQLILCAALTVPVPLPLVLAVQPNRA